MAISTDGDNIMYEPLALLAIVLLFAPEVCAVIRAACKDK